VANATAVMVVWIVRIITSFSGVVGPVTSCRTVVNPV
jgi:hypothetical protein